MEIYFRAFQMSAPIDQRNLCKQRSYYIMVQSRKSSNGIYAILGMGVITALLIVGSGHIAIPFAFNSNYGYDDYYSYKPRCHKHRFQESNSASIW